jgi:hypothetical protein
MRGCGPLLGPQSRGEEGWGLDSRDRQETLLGEPILRYRGFIYVESLSPGRYELGHRCHQPIYRVSLRAGVTGTSSFVSYDDDNPFDLHEFDTNGSALSPREEPWMLDPDLVE